MRNTGGWGQASAAIPDQHINSNGATVGTLACFYGSAGLYCYDTASKRWLPPVTSLAAPHTGGAIVALNNRVFIAGGYDASAKDQHPVDTVDIVEVTVN